MSSRQPDPNARYALIDEAVPVIQAGIWLAGTLAPMAGAVACAYLAGRQWEETGSGGLLGWVAAIVAMISFLLIAVITMVILRRCRLDWPGTKVRMTAAAVIVLAIWCAMFTIQTPAIGNTPPNPAGLAIVWTVVAAAALGAAAYARRAGTIPVNNESTRRT
ncbi:hypothetical protein [Dietzia sp. 179-F 9C3 NHS]|uniref:hypothetical protein n=1 Tax=Dietzia sp. 179-F 9C3 NHS TaxID=3374295 RepID=UPI0038799A36